MMMEIEPKEENPWLSHVEIWSKKMEFEKAEKERKEEEQRVLEEEEEEEEEEKRKSAAVAENDENAIDEGQAGVVGLLRNLAAGNQKGIKFQYFNIHNNHNSDQLYNTQRAEYEEDSLSKCASLPLHGPSSSFSPSQSISSIFYACFLFTCLASIALITWHFISSLHKDVSFRVTDRYNTANQRIIQCSNDWSLNGCDNLAKSIPHMAIVCKEWEECMRQDPQNIDRLAILGSVFSSLVNSFIDPLSWKAVVVSSAWFVISALSLIHAFATIHKSK